MMKRVAEGCRDDDVAAHYDELDSIYRMIWEENLHHGLWEDGVKSRSEAAARMTEFIGDRLHLREGQRVWDVGCGFGRMMSDLVDRFGVKAGGVTISRKQWEQAASGADVRLGDWLQNDLPDGEFDAVMAVESLEHMSDPKTAVSEMLRVTKPGGRVVLACWMEGDRLRAWEKRLLIDPIRRDGMLGGMADEGRIREYLDEAGAEQLVVDDLSRQVERTWSDCLKRALRLALSDRGMQEALGSDWRRSVRMGLTLNRIWAAYVLGAIRYQVFSARRPG
ncbi:class I SAM-dependent methyltransferase [Haloferula chungangensis]|uniref:Class I SAM-dependent methyltransferase n=1 Tax=Haloferula chungangensis TaxID=1048331 RepID=A0ABW2L7G6_9BACT